MVETFLITGAAGFIGSHLCRALLARHGDARVVGVDNFDHFYPRERKLANIADLQAPADAKDATRFQIVEADIRERAAMRDLFEQHRPKAVFHLAALAGVRPSIAEPARYVSVNLDGTMNLLEAARQVECRDFIFASSSSVYGNNKKAPFAETDPVHEPISPYAATKAAGELICHTHAHLFHMRIAALRFFTVYGPGQRPDLAIASFMRKIAQEDEIPMFGDGTTSRDYTYIDDIIEGILAAYDRIVHQQEAAPFFRIYNLGGSDPIALRDMIGYIEEVAGCKANIRRLPMQPGDVERTWADLTRSGAELGYRPRTPFIEGLRKQWEAMRRMQRG